MQIIFLILLLIFYFGKVLFPQAGKIIYGGDLLSQFYFWKGFLVENLKNGIIPFWNPYLFSGSPFLAHPSIAFFYPATILFLLLPLNIAFSWNYFIHLIVAGLGLAYVSEKYIDRFSSLIVSFLFVLSGFFAARIYAGHVDLLTTSVWIPWVFGYFRDTLETGSKKKMVMAIVFLSLEILAGYQAYVLFTLEFLALYTVYFYYFKAKDHGVKVRFSKKLLLAIAIVFFSIMITSLQWVPTFQLSRLSIRGRGLPYELATWGSLPVSSLKLFLQPLDREELNKISFNLGGGSIPNPFDHYTGRFTVLIIGIYLLGIILDKLFKLRQKNLYSVNCDFWFFLSASILFIWISMAYFAVPNLHWLLYNLIPFYKFIRIPIQHLVIPVFLIPLMVGMILNTLKNNWLKAGIAAVIMADLFIFGQKYIFLTDIPEKNYDKNLISYLENNLHDGRILPKFRVISPVLQAFDLNAVMKYKYYSTSGYDPLILDNYYRFIDNINHSNDSSILQYNVEIPPLQLTKDSANYLSIKYVLTEAMNDLGKDNSGDFKLIGKSNIWSLYQNLTPSPKFFLECQKQESDRIHEISRSLNYIELKVDTNCFGLLSSSEIYYPGWRVKVDGREEKVIESNLTFRSVFLPPGLHAVKFYYRPDIYYIGAVLSLLGVIGLIKFIRLI